MIGGSVARRYARAILSIGLAQNNYDNLAGEIERLANTLEQSTDLRTLLENPAFSLPQRQAVVTSLTQRLALSKITHTFAMLLLSRGRITMLPSIARQLRTMADEQAGRVRAKVTSATPLDPAAESRIRSAIGRATGKAVVLDKHVDPALIGGVVTQVGDVVYDGSVASELAQLRQRWSS